MELKVGDSVLYLKNSSYGSDTIGIIVDYMDDSVYPWRIQFMDDDDNWFTHHDVLIWRKNYIETLEDKLEEKQL